MNTGTVDRLILAKQNLDEANMLLTEQMGNKLVIAKLYHAMMQCLFALFGVRDAAKLTHADLIERLNGEYIRAGKFDASVFDALRRAYDLMHECDCEHMPVPTDEETKAAMAAAEQLIRATENHLVTEGNA